jgi:hypothetical protein
MRASFVIKSAMDGAKRSLDEGVYVTRSTQPGLDPR